MSIEKARPVSSNNNRYHRLQGPVAVLDHYEIHLLAKSAKI